MTMHVQCCSHVALHCKLQAFFMLQGQSEDVSEQLNEEEQLLVISRLHQVPA